MKVKLLISIVVGFSTIFSSSGLASSDYQALTKLFAEWREFERPPNYQGAPDYRPQTFAGRWSMFLSLRNRLNSIAKDNLKVAEQIDWMIVWAEMNGYEFNQKVLKPWQRDPTFYKSVWTYQSDVPAHEGPTHHAVTELWQYQFPLNDKAVERLISDLSVIPAINQQAKQNLTGNARELWIAGIRDIRNQVAVLQQLQLRTADQSQVAAIASAKLTLAKSIDRAIESTKSLVQWLEERANSKTGPSGLGKQAYTWYLNNVHLVPMTWDDEVALLQRELSRAWSSLKLEEVRNRKLPELNDAKSAKEYDEKVQRGISSLLSFLEEQEIVTVADYFEPALQQHTGQFVPKETRNFFWITAHLDPRPLQSHFYHWFELARMRYQPHSSPIRRNALLYNIFDSRNEGTATAIEEILMHAGLYDDSPRSRELVWIMLAQRAARGLGSLYAHANDMTMEQAGNIHMEWTPRGWMKTEPELLIFEQHLYLRQPGYGTSYVTGKALLDRSLQAFAKQYEAVNQRFVLKDFFDQLSAIGCIPMALSHWQLTGDGSEVKAIFDNYQPLDSLLGDLL
ncbi:MAG: hypothetical protein V2I33_13345 [Kangiellaceae bacterium]|jgi:hypothetical protein|nr:hypothetical protein [Kangiellaceae bacterium]